MNSEENSDSTEKVNSESNSVNEVKMQRRNRKKKSTMLSSRIKTVLVSIALLATVIGLFVLSPLQIVKPTLGASIGFGSADSSLVVALAVDEISPGTPVVAYLGSDKDTIVFGSLSQMVDEAVLIQTDGGFAQSSKENLIGRSVLVIPFLGKLF